MIVAELLLGLLLLLVLCTAFYMLGHMNGKNKGILEERARYSKAWKKEEKSTMTPTEEEVKTEEVQ